MYVVRLLRAGLLDGEVGAVTVQRNGGTVDDDNGYQKKGTDHREKFYQIRPNYFVARAAR